MKTPYRLLLLTSLLLTLAGRVLAGDVEPRLYSNVPVGANFLSLAYARSDGEVTFDSSIPVQDVEGEVRAMLLSYSRGIAIGGQSGLLTIAVPYANAKLEGLYLGQPASGERHGMGDPIVRLAWNFYGAPALSREQFSSYQQGTIAGASLSASMPAGRYREDKLVNAGSNRWTVSGQVGVSHRISSWTLESALGFDWFSDNQDFLDTNTVEQEPIVLFRSAVVYDLTRRIWLSAGFIYSAGGATSLNGVKRDDRQSNWRTGAALSMPLGLRHRLQLRATEGVSARIGSDYRTYAAVYTYAF